MQMPAQVFNFAGQTRLDTYAIEIDFGSYDDLTINGMRLMMEAIRRQVAGFATWQRRRPVGRPAADERVLLTGVLLMEAFSTSFREAEGLLGMHRQYFGIEAVPDHSVLCRWQGTARCTKVMDRFFQHVLASLPQREVIVSTDATGYSSRKRGWRETKHAARAKEKWTKANVAIGVDEFLVLSYHLSGSDVHESQTFEEVWDQLPENVEPIQSLADSAYCSEKCLAVARRHGATPFHRIKSNARNFSRPCTNYQKQVNFARHWPNRYRAFLAKRAHSETVFSMIGSLFGYRLRCRNSENRRNEVRIKFVIFNIFQLARRESWWS
jgi:transposase